MTVTYDTPTRGSHTSMATLEDRFEVIKEIGDGSFGSVAVARVRTAGAHIARRGTMVRNSKIGGVRAPTDSHPRLRSKP
jgi:meiosis induction protein kinase IME2/SME1